MLCNRNNLPGNFEVIRIRRNQPWGNHNYLQAHDHHGGGGGGGALAVAGPASASTATQSSPVLITGYQVTCGAWTRCGPQRWIDSSAKGHGNLPFDGNIRGC